MSWGTLIPSRQDKNAIDYNSTSGYEYTTSTSYGGSSSDGPSTIPTDYQTTTPSDTTNYQTTTPSDTTNYQTTTPSDTTTPIDSTTTFIEPPSDPLSPGAIAGIVIASILALALLAVAVVTLYRKRKCSSCCYGNDEGGRPGGKKTVKILQEYFPDDQSINHDFNDSTMVQREFQELYMFKPAHPTFTAKLPENLKKNRYADVLPFDENIAQLQSRRYINASLISPIFIATQDPMMLEEDDFWPMVCDNNVRIMVRLSTDTDGAAVDNDDRQIRVAVYIPPKKWVFPDDLEVTNRKVDKTNDYTKTELEVNQRPSKREVFHYHVQNWESSTFPAFANTLETIIEIKTARRSLDKSGVSKVLVHCGAGTGRTGTFIAIWMLMDALDKGEDSNVLNLCKTLREQRTGMVTNEAQYNYIYECGRAYSEFITSTRH